MFRRAFLRALGALSVIGAGLPLPLYLVKAAVKAAVAQETAMLELEPMLPDDQYAVVVDGKRIGTCENWRASATAGIRELGPLDGHKQYERAGRDNLYAWFYDCDADMQAAIKAIVANGERHVLEVCIHDAHGTLWPYRYEGRVVWGNWGVNCELVMDISPHKDA
jgi:hypothetical protein